MTEGTISATIAGIWWFEQSGAYFRLIPVTVSGALSACDRAYSLGAVWHRTVSRIIEYAFLAMHAFASGWFAFASYMCLDLSTYRRAVLPYGSGDLGEAELDCKTSFDLKSFIECVMLHDILLSGRIRRQL